MKRALSLILLVMTVLTGNAQNPFAAYGYQPKMATMSNGRYDECHDRSRIVEIGSVRFDTKTNKIVGIVNKDTTITDVEAQTVSRFISIDPHAERYYSISPYAYCKNNPIRLIDPDGQDGWDVVVGYGIGLLTNIIPGSGNLRDTYAPTDPSDYNNALQGMDNASILVGDGMVKIGGGGMAVGGGAVAVGVTATAASGGTLAIGGVPVAVVGGALIEAGATTATTGAVLMTNGKENKEAGYNRGRGSNHLKPSPEATGDHSSFRRDSNGKITNITTYKVNDKNPTGFDEVKRIDITGSSHQNGNGKEIPTPHVHEGKTVRPANPDELPKR